MGWIDVRVQERDGDRFDFFGSAATAATLSPSSGSISPPCASSRSRTSNRSVRGTGHIRALKKRLYMSGLFLRPISRTSRKPSVVSSVVLTPVRWRTALMAMVDP